MELETLVKMAIYGHFAETGRCPSPKEVAGRVDAPVDTVLAAYRALAAQRLLVIEADGLS